MEQLQMLKYMLKKGRLDFTSSWRCEEVDLEAENECQDRGLNLVDELALEMLHVAGESIEGTDNAEDSDSIDSWTATFEE
jgi:hypothetical protein